MKKKGTKYKLSQAMVPNVKRSAGGGEGSVKYVEQDKYNVVVKNATKSNKFFASKNCIK